MRQILKGVAVLLAAALVMVSSPSQSDAKEKKKCPGTKGCVPKHQPDVNKDGDVVIGILSGGDTNDGGYYESFVIAAREFATRNGWELNIVDHVNPADAATQARNLCRQHVDMVAIASSELKDAIPVSEEDVCKGTVWYVAAGTGVQQTPYFVQTSERVEQNQYATGYAAALVLQKLGKDKAGFITGPELDFSVTAYKAFAAGVHSVLPDAEVFATYTGSFDDSAAAREAATAQISQGAGILYPYLGGATDAVASLGKDEGLSSIAPGTDRCSDSGERFAIASIYSPGDFFAATLTDFERGKVKLGITRVFRLGKDPVPTVKVCESTEDASQLQDKVDGVIQQISEGKINAVAKAKAEV